MRARVCSALAVVLLLASLTPDRAEAQRRPPPRPRPRVEARRSEPKVLLGLSVIGAQAQGDFGQRVDDAFGGQLDVTVPVAVDGRVRVHGELGGLVYGHEHSESCFPAPVGCRIDLDLDTENTIFFAGVGPEFAWPGPVTPYLNTTAGISYFSTFSSLDGGGTGFGSTEHFDDAVFGVQVGAGVRARVTSGRMPLYVDVGARYHWNDDAEYLVEGDIMDQPDGTIQFVPHESDANLFALHLGLSVGIGAERGRAASARRRGRP